MLTSAYFIIKVLLTLVFINGFVLNLTEEKRSIHTRIVKKTDLYECDLYPVVGLNVQHFYPVASYRVSSVILH